MTNTPATASVGEPAGGPDVDIDGLGVGGAAGDMGSINGCPDFEEDPEEGYDGGDGFRPEMGGPPRPARRHTEMDKPWITEVTRIYIRYLCSCNISSSLRAQGFLSERLFNQYQLPSYSGLTS